MHITHFPTFYMFRITYRPDCGELLKARLVYCNDYYMEIQISITKNTLSWSVINITIH